MQDLIAALVSFFLVQPLQAELADRLAAAGAPRTLLTRVADCARTATPLIVERAANDPWWAASSVVSVWVGSARAEALLVQAAPSCAPAVEAARPFLNRQAS